MKRLITSLVTLFLTIHVNANNDMNGQPSAIGLDYFGEQPQGLTPQLFEPKIVSPNGLFEGGRFSPDKREYYFSRNNGKYKKRTFLLCTMTISVGEKHLKQIFAGLSFLPGDMEGRYKW